jgi:hypothetical protein
MRASESDPVWQILRQYRNGQIVTSTYALMGEFKGVWNDRVLYFPAAIPDPNNPLDGDTVISGSLQTAGLTIGGRATTVSINSTTWTALPPSALENRNAVCIQNYSGKLVKLNYSNLVSGFNGIILPDSAERYYDISDTIFIYAKCDSGTAELIIEEIS